MENNTTYTNVLNSAKRIESQQKTEALNTVSKSISALLIKSMEFADSRNPLKFNEVEAYFREFQTRVSHLKDIVGQHYSKCRSYVLHSLVAYENGTSSAVTGADAQFISVIEHMKNNYPNNKWSIRLVKDAGLSYLVVFEGTPFFVVRKSGDRPDNVVKREADGSYSVWMYSLADIDVAVSAVVARTGSVDRTTRTTESVTNKQTTATTQRQSRKQTVAFINNGSTNQGKCPRRNK